MISLSEQQVTLILDRITGDGVTDTELRNDLLDHYCCFVEERMEAGQHFDLAYNEAFNKISPNGMWEIQDELNFILNFKQQTIMKTMIYGSGFLAAFCVSTGIMFKTLHWDWAAALGFLLAGLLSLIVTIVSLLSNSIKHIKTHTPAYTFRVFAGFIAALLIAVGSIFKLLRYPTADMQLVVGLALLNLVFLPLFFYQLYKKAMANSIKGNTVEA